MESLFKYAEANNYFKNEDIYLIKTPKKPKKLPRALNYDNTKDALNLSSIIEYGKKNSES